MSKYKKNNKNVLRAVIASIFAVLVLAVAFAANVFAEGEEVEYIYFDLAADNVTINASTYKGSVYVNGVKTDVTGTHSSENHYYVYQSTTANKSDTGYLNGYPGKITLPEYGRVKASNDESWGEFITNHPGDTNASTDDEADYDGSASVEAVITEWIEYSGRKETEYNITVTPSDNMNCEIVLDNVYSTYQSEKNQGRTDGGIIFNASGKKNAKLTLLLKGDNRFGNIFYCSEKGKNTQIIFKDYKNGNGTLTVANVKDKGSNYWCAAIGGNDGSQGNAYGIKIEGGIIYAGTTAADDCTAIGGGGNDIGGVTISGGTVTAVVSSSGAAIGGGIGKKSVGGTAEIRIEGGSVYAYNFSCKSNGYSNKDIAYIPAAAIGGGSSAQQTCNPCDVEISGGYVYAQSVGGTAIGGGSSSDSNGGDATVIISGGTVEAKSVSGYITYENKDKEKEKYDVPAGIAIGGGTGYAKGGTATLNVSGDAVLYTGSIGGGGYNTEKEKELAGTANAFTGKIGPAFVTISGGTVQGQIVMQGSATIEGKEEHSTFEMTGGTINNANAASSGYVFQETNGGAVCVKSGTATISGGIIENCGNTSILGGAIYLTGGNVTVSGGTIQNCKAQNGGAVYVAGGSFSMNGGEISGNKAQENGGAVCVSDGNVTMKGGKVSGNEAIEGKGGAFYVSSETSDVSVTVTSGEISGNSAKGNGGAIAVQGAEGKTVIVTIGIHAPHETDNPNCDHDAVAGYDMECPQIKNNTTNGEGGAIHISGTLTTELNIYCLTEEGNRGGGLPAGNQKTTLSDFLKVDGGKVVISSAETNTDGCDNFNYGKSIIHGSMHVKGGEVDLWGSMENPIFYAPITVDTVKEDDYEDHRKNDGTTQYYNIHYFENFILNGVPSGQYTAYQVKEGDIHTVVGVIYSHPGHSIEGWNTDKNAKLPTEGIWYYPSNTVGFPDEHGNFPNGYNKDTYTLILYAIWDKNVYTIHFEPNVPQGTPVSGTMADITASCADEVTLPENTFVHAGHIFQGWSENKNATKAEYNDGATEEPLTTDAGETVTLYAVWAVCDHKDDKHTYSVSTDYKTLTCTCVCTYYITVTISAQDTVYDGNAHPAELEFFASSEGSTNPFMYTDGMVEDAKAAISYEKKGDENYSDLDEGLVPTNAGTYKASLTYSGNTIYVVYVIDKAQQTPPVKPEFVAANSKITIDTIEASSQTLNAANFIILYADSDGWKSKDVGAALEHTIDTGWTSYYVQAYYPGNENYYDSPVSSSNATFYTGDVEVTVVVNAGLTYEFDTTGTAKIVIKPIDKYYVQNYQIGSGIKFDVILKGTNESNAVLNKIDQFTFELLNVSNSTDEKITITFDDAKLIPVVSSSVIYGEKFGDFANTFTSIANDSAFTSYFMIENYDSETYTKLSLAFNKSLPVGTTIIMVDRSGQTYWYIKVTNETVNKKTFLLTDFNPMANMTSYVLSAGEIVKYQFIVDFSDVAGVIDPTTLTAKLTAEESDTYAPDLSGITENGVNVKLTSVSEPNLELEQNDAGVLSKDTVSIKFPESEGVASKWENLNGALVVTPKTGVVLPPDVELEVVEIIGNITQTTVYPRSENGSFIVSIDKDAESVSFRLKSEMPTESNYEFTITMYAACVDSAPGSNIKLGEITDTSSIELSLSKTKTPSAKITGTQKVCALNDKLLLNVTLDLAGYTDYDILLMKDDGKSYNDTAWKYDKPETPPQKNEQFEVEVDLGGQQEGNYCVAVIVRNSQNATVLKSNYYFVIID